MGASALAERLPGRTLGTMLRGGRWERCSGQPLRKRTGPRLPAAALRKSVAAQCRDLAATVGRRGVPAQLGEGERVAVPGLGSWASREARVPPAANLSRAVLSAAPESCLDKGWEGRAGPGGSRSEGKT